MATGIIPRTHVTYGEFRASLSADTANQLSDHDGNPTSLVLNGNFPANPNECIYQVVTVGTDNFVNVSVHLDGDNRKTLYAVTDVAQITTFRWYRII